MVGDQDPEYFYAIVRLLCIAIALIAYFVAFPFVRTNMWFSKKAEWARQKQLESDKETIKARAEMDNSYKANK